MKEKVLKVLKIVLMIFGVLFLIQIFMFLIMMLGAFNFADAKGSDFDFNFDFDKVQTSTKPKEMQPIINYVEDYQIKNKKYPEKVENVKVKKDLNYKYEPTKDGNCYTITINEKNTTKQYQHCKTSSVGANSTSESYVEYSNKK